MNRLRVRCLTCSPLHCYYPMNRKLWFFLTVEAGCMDIAEIRYTSTHEWCKIEEGSIVIGVTPNALAAIGDVVYIELPAAGEDVLKEIPFGEIEGTEGVKDLISPMDGLVLDVNLRLSQNPDLMAKKPLEDTWLIRLKPDGPVVLDNLLSATAYEAMTKKKKRSR